MSIKKGAHKKVTYWILGVGIFASVAIYIVSQTQRKPTFEMHFFNTPGGMSYLIRTPEDRRILINGGANTEIIRDITHTLPFYSRRIDFILATDSNSKHVTGLVDVLNRYSIGEVYESALTLTSLGISSSTDQIYKTLEETINNKNVKRSLLKISDRIQLGVNTFADVLFPVDSNAFKYSNASAPQLVLRIVYGTTSILLIGDSSTKIQKYVATTTKQQSDTLVFDGNPSAANLSYPFVNTIKPSSIIYSADTKSPSLKLRRTKEKTDPLVSILSNNRFNVRQTGEVVIVSDGNELEVLPFYFTR